MKEPKMPTYLEIHLSPAMDLFLEICEVWDRDEVFTKDEVEDECGNSVTESVDHLLRKLVSCGWINFHKDSKFSLRVLSDDSDVKMNEEGAKHSKRVMETMDGRVVRRTARLKKEEEDKAWAVQEKKKMKEATSRLSTWAERGGSTPTEAPRAPESLSYNSGTYVSCSIGRSTDALGVLKHFRKARRRLDKCAGLVLVYDPTHYHATEAGETLRSIIEDLLDDDMLRSWRYALRCRVVHEGEVPVEGIYQQAVFVGIEIETMKVTA